MEEEIDFLEGKNVLNSLLKCNVVVAGSEKVKNDGQTKAEHLLESNNINKSLLVLGK